MSGRTRVFVVVALAAVVAAGLAVAAGLRGSDSGDGSAATAQRPTGAPALALDLGLGDDARTRELREAVELYRQGRRAQAGAIFRRHTTLPARIGALFSAWPNGTLARMRALARANRASAEAQLHLGLALYWSSRLDEAQAAWRDALRADPDTISAVRANDLLHPRTPPGLPAFVPSFRAPPEIASLPAARQLATLARRARTGGARDFMLYGIALQRIGRPLSAERAYAAAARLAPGDVEAQVAAAVGRFRKDAPERAFSRLGPLAQRHPRSPTVRFHLGLLLLWLGDVDEAKAQLRRARASGPQSVLGREANRFLMRLEGIGSR
jgi:tetratricopeptide (TPR) repeat protein